MLRLGTKSENVHLYWSYCLTAYIDNVVRSSTDKQLPHIFKLANKYSSVHVSFSGGVLTIYLLYFPTIAEDIQGDSGERLIS